MPGPMGENGREGKVDCEIGRRIKTVYVDFCPRWPSSFNDIRMWYRPGMASCDF